MASRYFDHTWVCFHVTCSARPTGEPARAVRAAISIASKVLEDERLPQGERDRRYVVGVNGIPGSGKTTTSTILAGLLQRALPNIYPRLMSQDGYHYTRAALDTFDNPEQAHLRRGAPFTFDVDAFASALRQFRNSEAATLSLPVFDHATRDPEPDSVIVSPATRLLVVEGNYLGLGAYDDSWARVRENIDLLAYLDVPTEVAMGRVEARHVTEIGLSAAEASFRVEKNDRPNAHLIASFASSADYIVKA